ncbi:MAG: peptide chain release factor 2 [Dehalococcoidia bacterium]|nr:peptide chain release factor 2 [Dehalococcoidia bacterium]
MWVPNSWHSKIGCSTSRCVFDLASKSAERQRLEKRALAADFWSDVGQAQKIMRRLTSLRDELETWDRLAAERSELAELYELAEVESDQEIIVEISDDLGRLHERLDALESRLALSGPYDDRTAILSVHAGAGGTESQDWAEMLLRMYLRWAERRRYRTDVLDRSDGEEAGIKSVALACAGRHAYGHLKAERGVHRLVRISPFDASRRRHTSFALVEVVPEVPDDRTVVISPDDIEIDTFRASGAGGQHVNKTSSAVRIRHRPSGIVVTCQNERSQFQNRDVAMRLLRAKLLERKLQEQEAEQARLRGEPVSAEWGNQIRSYVLHPYSMVKDLRTSVETSNAQAVLDGDLDAFIEAWLRSQIGTSADTPMR